MSLRRAKNSTKNALAFGLSAITALYMAACSRPKQQINSINAPVQIADIFTKEPLGGTVIVNGTSKASGSSFEVENGVISSLDVIVPGYFSPYIVGRDPNGKVVYTRGRFGPLQAKLTQDTTIIAYLIPDNFDITLFANCVGSDGVVQNYNKQTVKIGIMKWTTDGQEPTADLVNKLNECIGRVNAAANNVIRLEYADRISSELSDGVTCRVRDSFPAHSETLNGNVIVKSFMGTRAIPDPGTRSILGELTQASTGLRDDGPGNTNGLVYIGGAFSGNDAPWQNDAPRAIQLANLLPPGFALDMNGVPGVVIQYPISDAGGSIFEPPTFGGPSRERFSYQEIPGRPAMNERGERRQTPIIQP